MMEYVLLRDYSPFKAGQIVRLPPMTAAKFLAAGIVAPHVVTRAPIRPVAHKMIEEPDKAKQSASITFKAKAVDEYIERIYGK
jgi:hypothetical protein